MALAPAGGHLAPAKTGLALVGTGLAPVRTRFAPDFLHLVPSGTGLGRVGTRLAPSGTALASEGRERAPVQIGLDVLAGIHEIIFVPLKPKTIHLEPNKFFMNQDQITITDLPRTVAGDCDQTTAIWSGDEAVSGRGFRASVRV